MQQGIPQVIVAVQVQLPRSLVTAVPEDVELRDQQHAICSAYMVILRAPGAHRCEIILGFLLDTFAVNPHTHSHRQSPSLSLSASRRCWGLRDCCL